MSTRSTNRSFKKLVTERDDVSPEDIFNTLCNQEVELIFTAHPTQVWQYDMLTAGTFDMHTQTLPVHHHAFRSVYTA